MSGLSNAGVSMQETRRTANLKDAPHEDAVGRAARDLLRLGLRSPPQLSAKVGVLLCAVSVGVVACLAEA